MPLYEYECFVCHHRFERIQKLSAEPLKICPECGGAVRRLLGAPALQFKGSGWYVTDYGKGTGGAAGMKRQTSSNGASDSSKDTSSPKPPSKPAKDSATASKSS